MYVYVYVRRDTALLELELETVMSTPWMLGTEPRSSTRTLSYWEPSQLLIRLSNTHFPLFV